MYTIQDYQYEDMKYEIYEDMKLVSLEVSKVSMKIKGFFRNGIKANANKRSH